MNSEKNSLLKRDSVFPESLPPPPSYYQGITAPQRLRCDNLVVFLRTNRVSLQQKNFANRSHHRHVLLLVLDTPGSVIIDGTEHRLEVKQAIYVQPFQFHHYVNLEGEALRWLFLTFDLELGSEAMAALSDLPLTLDSIELTLWSQVVQAATKTPGTGRTEALVLLDHLLFRLVQSQSAAPLTATRSSWIAKAEGLIVQSIEKSWSVDQIGKKLGLSGRHLRSLFEAEMGVNIREYRSNYQLHRAISLMRDQKLTMGRIAELSGFNSQSVFNRFIKRKSGKTPTRLRQTLLAREA